MRNYRITVGGKTYHIEIDDPHASPIRVRVDGKPFEVYVEGQGGEPGTAPEPDSLKPSKPAPAPQVRTPKPAAPSIGEGEVEEMDILAAPMPGTILSIAVREGDHVRRGQEVCVLEAMKMKNSIKSPREGTITEVTVSVGARVAYGDPLVRFR